MTFLNRLLSVFRFGATTAEVPAVKADLYLSDKAVADVGLHDSAVATVFLSDRLAVDLGVRDT